MHEQQLSPLVAEMVADSASRMVALLNSLRFPVLSAPDPEPPAQSTFANGTDSQHEVDFFGASGAEPIRGNWTLSPLRGAERGGCEYRQDERVERRDGFCFKVEECTPRSSAMGEKLSGWKRDGSSEELPPLLSLKSEDSLVSLELSLKTEGPQTGNSSPANISTAGEAPETGANPSGTVDFARIMAALQSSERPAVRPFQAIFAKVKEEPGAVSSSFSQGLCKVEPGTGPSASAVEEDRRRELSGEANWKERKVRDFFLANHAMGPFTSSAVAVKAEPADELMPSCSDQAKVSCTLEKIEVALQRSQFSRKETGNSSHLNVPSWCTSRPSSPPSVLLSLQPRSASPTTSDASSAASSRSALHSTAVMKFQGEELDGPGASSSDASPPPPPPQARLDVLGCQTCHMYVMVCSDRPGCPKCGSTALLNVRPLSPRKRQRLEWGNVGTDGRATWDALNSR